MKTIGLTGGIGSGKSVILKVFASLGVPCYQSDTRAKKLMQEDEELVGNIKEMFGDDIYNGQELNRSQLAELVFSDKKKLEGLNALVHPAVKKDFNFFFKQQKAPYIIKEAAILFETGIYKNCDLVILICAPKEDRIVRVMHRDGLNRSEVLKSCCHN